MISSILPPRHLIVRCGRVFLVGFSLLGAVSSHAEPPASPEKLLNPVEIHVDPEPLKLNPTGSPPPVPKQSPIPARPPYGSTSSPWVEGAVINILADQTPLEDVLQEFGNQMNIRVFSSPGVRGKVSGRFVGMTPQSFLDQLSRAYGLDWLYYNQQIYFSSNMESGTIVRMLRYLPGDQAVKVVEQMGMFGVGSSIRGVPGTPLVMLSGPPRFLEMAQEVLRTLEMQNAYKQNERVIQVFPINYAWAYDVQLVSGGGPGTVQGVATLLSQLVAGGSGGQGPSLGNYTPQSRMLNSVLDKAGNQQRVARAFPPDRADTADGAKSPSRASTSGSSDNTWTNETPNQQNGAQTAYPATMNVSIVADVRSNSVIIRDVLENMPFYKAAIAKLDIPVKVVEISASIVDADINSGRILGMSGITIAPLGPLASFQANVANGGGILLSGVYGTSSINAAINFLETNNRAKTLSRPTLVTLDNYAASISDTQTVYVPIQGGRDTPGNLFAINSGLTLQVVPHITMERGQPQVSLQIAISEGKTDTTGGNTSKQTNLMTQAVVRMDQSLLIGGLYRKLTSKERSGYPWLSNIPIVNFLFSTQSKKQGVVERLILITPRVVDIYSKNLGDYSQYFRPSPLVQKAEQISQDVQTTGMPGVLPVTGKKRKSSNEEF